MAKVFTPQDCHILMADIVKQATGQEGIKVVDSSSFVSAGETALATGVENTLRALSLVVGRTIIAVRPYKASLYIIDALNSEIYSHRLRKISYYSKNPQASGDWNTDLYTNLANGFTNGQNITEDAARSTKSMWEQNQPIPLEMNFGGQDVWEDSITTYKYQLQTAFRNESEFASFLQGILTAKANDIERQKEAFNRMAILNKIASVYDMSNRMPGSVVNLTKAFNDRFGTAYTSEQLRTTYLKEFLAFFVATFKVISKRMTHSSTNYHWSPAKTVDGEELVLLRHTPYADQRVMLYTPLFVEAEALVLPEIFHDGYLDLDTQYEGVDYWQSFTTPSAINVIPAITNESGVQVAGDAVNLPYVVGMIFDRDSLLTDYQLEDAEVTPMEARKKFYNTWWSFSKNVISDNSENTVIFIMEN